jgi:hypothetical protein
MRLQPFEMERWQSTWENQVEYNLSESGVHPMRLNEILGVDSTDLLNQSLGYTQTNGTHELRKTIASYYPNATADNVLVTNGSSEANFVSLWSFLEKGAEVVILLPNYMQIWGLAKTMQAKVKPSWLREGEDGWTVDFRSLRKIVSKRTKLIAVCNPNNPTGAVLNEEMVDQICEVAKKTGSWVLSDEVYHGAELNGKEAPTFWSRYEKVIVTNGLSKAYGLPGLRVGWILTKPDLANKLWSYHDYTTICLSALSDYLARRVLQPETRAKILGRTRNILRTNLPILRDWVERNREHFSFSPPKAGAIAYLKHTLKMKSVELANRLLKEKSTLIVPGEHFGMKKHVRVGYGCQQDYLKSGLHRISEFIERSQPASGT